MANDLTFKEKHDLIYGKAGSHKIPLNAEVIVVDRSGSMASNAFEGKSAIDCVREALKSFTGRAHVLAFDDRVEEVPCDAIPNPRGGTDLALALRHLIPREPIHVLVMCDGQPDSNKQAFDAAKELAQQCIIDTLYIGPENDTQAVEFMRELAAVGHGRFNIFSLTTKSPLLLGESVSNLLALPDHTVVKL